MEVRIPDKLRVKAAVDAVVNVLQKNAPHVRIFISSRGVEMNRDIGVRSDCVRHEL